MNTDFDQRERQLKRIRDLGVAWLVPLFILGGVVVVDINTGQRFIAWIVLVPGIAAAVCGVRTTAAYVMASLVGYLYLSSVRNYDQMEGMPDFVLVATGGVLAVLACAVRVRSERRMLHMRDIAETTRRTVLRPMPPVWAGLEQAAVYLAADSDARVGGDFYDIQPGPHGVRVLVGDVQGKGLGAVDAAAALLGTFREAGYHEPELASVAARLETRMLRRRSHMAAIGRDDGDRFATGILLGFPTDGSATVDVVNFGHEPPLAVSRGGIRPLPAPGGLPLGMSELHTDVPKVHRVPVAVDETLLLVTDGVTEARDEEGEFYPLAREVTRAVSADPRRVEPRRLVAWVRDGTLAHCGGRLADDTTIFAVRRAVRADERTSALRYGQDLRPRNPPA